MKREELVQSAVESAANIGGQVGAVGRRSYRRGTGLAEGELGSEARRPGDRGHADPGSHGAVHPGPTADGTRGRSASLGRRGISHTTATAPAFVIPRRRVAPRVQRQYKVQQGAIAPWAGAIRKRMERIAPGDPDGLTDWVGLIGLPPPPVEVPVAPVAPWSSPLANLASRLVTLVSPLRGDT
ncbi:hypothetical protein NFJ02_07g132310 [Pycnococcus provasolii]